MNKFNDHLEVSINNDVKYDDFEEEKDDSRAYSQQSTGVFIESSDSDNDSDSSDENKSKRKKEKGKSKSDKKRFLKELKIACVKDHRDWSKY